MLLNELSRLKIMVKKILIFKNDRTGDLFVSLNAIIPF